MLILIVQLSSPKWHGWAIGKSLFKCWKKKPMSPLSWTFLSVMFDGFLFSVLSTQIKGILSRDRVIHHFNLLFLMIADAETVFISLPRICMSPLEKYCSGSWLFLWGGGTVFLPSSCPGFLLVLDANSHYDLECSQSFFVRNLNPLHSVEKWDL